MGLKKQIIQYKDGNEVGVYDSATDAARAIGSTKSNVSKCCVGKMKMVNGFTFRYSGELTNKVERNVSGDFVCPICGDRFETYNGLCKHLFKYKRHGEIDLTKEQLLADIKYGGVIPTCACGCGEHVHIDYGGGAHFRKYLPGHHDRVHNNWGHNPKAIANSAETRRRQYANGEREPWNKGKKWEEVFDEETIARLMAGEKSAERSKKISGALKGVAKSPEHAEKCRQNGKSEKSIQINREKMRERLSSGEFNISSMIENEFVKKCIEPLCIDFDRQYYIEELHHYCDVYIPSANMIIEFQGDYWHGNPKKYLKEDLSEYQLKKVEKDEKLREYCTENGIQLVEVWESDFKKDKDGTAKMIEMALAY